LGLCLEWCEYLHEHASAHACARTRITILGTLCMSFEEIQNFLKWNEQSTLNDFPTVNFINILRAHFLYEILAPKNFNKYYLQSKITIDMKPINQVFTRKRLNCERNLQLVLIIFLIWWWLGKTFNKFRSKYCESFCWLCWGIFH